MSGEKSFLSSWFGPVIFACCIWACVDHFVLSETASSEALECLESTVEDLEWQIEGLESKVDDLQSELEDLKWSLKWR